MSAALSPRARQLCAAIAALAAGGIAVSALSLRHHYATSATSFCTFGESFNCDLVNRSEYSTFLGVPVALLGVLGYAAILWLATGYRRNPDASALLLIASLAGLGFALYLTYIEAYVLLAWCILCLSSLAAITGITVISAWLWRTQRKAN
ncbi:MAG: hypothetical protein JST79_21505 [Acidobacteria bacterium]|nr:hypothetical protein [Acidobacteriota bacterium]